MPYFNPHSFRHTLVALGQQLCQTPEAYKAWSQNLGHEAVLTTLTSYGAVASARQAELMEQLRSEEMRPDDARLLLRNFARLLQEAGMGEATRL